MKPAGINIPKKIHMPGLWEDVDGGIHFSLPDILKNLDMPDTVETRKWLTQVLKEMMERQHPGGEHYSRATEGQSYGIALDGKSIRCIVCGHVSFNPNDVAQKYCGFCHKFHEGQNGN